MGPTALRPIRRTKQWLSVLLKDTSVTAGDSNPHSADQKHQSLNSVLLTARPRHFHSVSTVYSVLSQGFGKQNQRHITQVGFKPTTFDTVIVTYHKIIYNLRFYFPFQKTLGAQGMENPYCSWRETKSAYWIQYLNLKETVPLQVYSCHIML